jgi:hypothetical protein
MDKVPFCGSIRVDRLKRISVSAKANEAKRDELRGLTNGLELGYRSLWTSCDADDHV